MTVGDPRSLVSLGEITVPPSLHAYLGRFAARSLRHDLRGWPEQVVVELSDLLVQRNFLLDRVDTSLPPRVKSEVDRARFATCLLQGAVAATRGCATELALRLSHLGQGAPPQGMEELTHALLDRLATMPENDEHAFTGVRSTARSRAIASVWRASEMLARQEVPSVLEHVTSSDVGADVACAVSLMRFEQFRAVENERKGVAELWNYLRDLSQFAAVRLLSVEGLRPYLTFLHQHFAALDNPSLSREVKTLARDLGLGNLTADRPTARARFLPVSSWQSRELAQRVRAAAANRAAGEWVILGAENRATDASIGAAIDLRRVVDQLEARRSLILAEYPGTPKTLPDAIDEVRGSWALFVKDTGCGWALRCLQSGNVQDPTARLEWIRAAVIHDSIGLDVSAAQSWLSQEGSWDREDLNWLLKECLQSSPNTSAYPFSPLDSEL